MVVKVFNKFNVKYMTHKMTVAKNKGVALYRISVAYYNGKIS